MWWTRQNAHPKEAPEEVYVPEEQAILDALNGLEACIDWRQGNTDANLIIEDRKWELFRRAMHEYDIIPSFNSTTDRWEAFDGTFR